MHASHGYNLIETLYDCWPLFALFAYLLIGIAAMDTYHTMRDAAQDAHDESAPELREAKRDESRDV